MSEIRKFDCPKCHTSIDYPVSKEGKAGNCPHCDERVWFSKLAHPDQRHPSSPPLDQEATTVPKRPQARTGTLFAISIAIVATLFVIDGLRLRGALQNIRRDLDSLRPTQSEQAESNTSQTAALAQAEINHAQLAAIVTELNAIETVIQKKLSQFSQRSTTDAEKIEGFETSLRSMATEIGELEFSITEIQSTLESLIESYNQLELDLNNR